MPGTALFEKPRWLRDLLRFLPLKSQFVLSGNIRDLQACEVVPGTVTAQSFNQTLCDALLDAGYAQVLAWDPLAGFRVLDDVHIREPRDPLAEWRLDSACGRVELLFRPEQLHQARPSVGLFYANTRQWFGRFNGTLRHDDGDCVPVDGALGWIGSTRARW